MELSEVLDGQLAQSVRQRVKNAPFRRLTDWPEQRIRRDVLCQTIHIDRMQGSPRPLIGEGQEAYMMHSVESAKQWLDRLYDTGIRRIYIGPELHSSKEGLDYRERLDEFVKIVASICQTAGTELDVIVDPARLCMRKDLRWGVTKPDNSLDIEATLALLAQAAHEFADAGVAGILTIGRLNCEVEVARAGAAKSARKISVLSFSTNSETTSAYFETTRHDVTRSRTGQKILVGNGTEMVVRSIADFGEGSDVIVQKPVEAFHLLATLRVLASNQMPIDAFVAQTPGVAAMLEANPLLRPAFERGAAMLVRGEKPLRTGTYEVSGTFSMVRLLAKNYGEELAWSLLALNNIAG
jgi:porphobilinogen synthase